MQSSNCCDIWSKFDATENLLFFNKYWTVILRPKQATIGSCIIIANRHVEALGSITPEEALAFQEVTEKLEAKLKLSMKYDKINYLAIMMKDPHLHFHVFPRYSTPRIINGVEYKDEAWPKPPDTSISLGDTTLLVHLRKTLKG